MIFVISLLFTLFFVLYSKHQFIDLKHYRDIRWKMWGVAMRITSLVGPFLLQLFPSPWQDYVLAGTINILLFEIGINVIALNTKPFYNGASSVLDNYLGNKKWFLIFTLILISITLKIFVK